MIRSRPAGTTLVGIDEETAIVGDGARWTVTGRGAVHLIADGTRSAHPAGHSFDLGLSPGAGRVGSA